MVVCGGVRGIRERLVKEYCQFYYEQDLVYNMVTIVDHTM